MYPFKSFEHRIELNEIWYERYPIGCYPNILIVIKLKGKEKVKLSL
jgi:hypothetical protein